MHRISNRDTDSNVLVLENCFIYCRASDGATDHLVCLTGVRADPQHLQLHSYNLGLEEESKKKAYFAMWILKALIRYLLTS